MAIFFQNVQELPQFEHFKYISCTHIEICVIIWITHTIAIQ